MDWVPIVATVLISLVVFIPIAFLTSALERSKLKRKIKEKIYGKNKRNPKR
jgi:hypothetical protein